MDETVFEGRNFTSPEGVVRPPMETHLVALQEMSRPSSMQIWLSAIIFGAIVAYLFLKTVLELSPNTSFKAPFSGSRYAWLARIRYAKSAQSTISTAYQSFQHSAWKLAGNDIIVLPQKYVEEIRAIPLFKANAMEANLETLQGEFTNLSVLNSTRLFVDVLKAKLNPQLGIVIPTLRKELDQCIAKELPPFSGDQWLKVDAFQTFHKINGRISARLFGGKELCDNRRFLDCTEGFLMNIFITAMSLRLVPAGFKTLFSWILPCSWSISSNFHGAISVLVPYIRHRQQTFKTRAEEIANEGKAEFPDILHYLIETAENDDAKPTSLAAMILSLSLASNQTTTMALVEALYDLCAHREYQTELRQEIIAAIREDGGWQKTSMTKMRKLDSFIKESQRTHPPAYSKPKPPFFHLIAYHSPVLPFNDALSKITHANLSLAQVGFKRKFREAVTLNDGTFIPAGAHIEFPITSIQDSVIASADEFDGFRYYRMRQDPNEAHKHQFASTSETCLHFGHGKYSCPGRFISASLIKMTLGTLLMDYEFKLDESGRPESLHVFEFNFPNPKTKLLLRKRNDADLQDISEFT